MKVVKHWRGQAGRGSILVFVLVMIVFLAALTLQLLDEAMRAGRYVVQYHKRDDLRLHAYSALEISLGALNEWALVEKQLFAPSQGWGSPLQYAEIESPESNVRWKVTIEDETGKIPFVAFNEKDLQAMFAVMAAEDEDFVDERDGEPYRDALLDWQDKNDDDRDEGAESDDHYEQLDPPYYPPNMPVQCFEEFRRIKGFSYEEDDPEGSGLFFDQGGAETANIRHFRSLVSFHNQHPLNVNTASEFLLRFLCGDDDRSYEELREILAGEQSSGEPFFRSLSDPRLADHLRGKRNLRLGAQCRVFRIHVEVIKGEANFHLHAVVEVGGPSAGQIPTAGNPAGGPRTSPAPRVPNTTGGATTRGGKRRGPLNPNFPKLQYPFRIIALRENENLVD